MKYLLNEEEYEELKNNKPEEVKAPTLNKHFEEMLRKSDIQVNPSAIYGRDVIQFEIKADNVPLELREYIKKLIDRKS